MIKPNPLEKLIVVWKMVQTEEWVGVNMEHQSVKINRVDPFDEQIIRWHFFGDSDLIFVKLAIIVHFHNFIKMLPHFGQPPLKASHILWNCGKKFLS